MLPAMGIPLAGLLFLGAAYAAPLEAGERLAWKVEWLGIEAGRAWATLRDDGGAWVVEAGCRSADWLAGLYPIEDALRSEWTDAGSRLYRTRFREGGFQQDQEMALGAEAFVVARRQLFDGAWRAWEDRYDAVAGAQDPVSAFYTVRVVAPEVGEDVEFPLWNGRRAVTTRIRTVGRESREGGDVLRVEIATASGQDVRGRMTVFLTDDADRVPVAATIETRAGPVKVALVDRALPAR